MALMTTKISEVIDSVNGTSFTGPVLTYVDNRHSENPVTYTWVLDAPRVRQWLGTKYYDWSFWWLEDPSVVTDPISGLAKRWSDYIADNTTNWERIFAAMMVQYDPISNYDRYEKGLDTSTHNNYKETVRIDQSTDTSYGTGNNAFKEVTTINESRSTDYGNGGYKETHTYSDSHSESWNKTHKEGPMSDDGTSITGSNSGIGSTKNTVVTDDGVSKLVSSQDMIGANVSIDSGSANANTTSNSGNNSTTRSGSITETTATQGNGNTVTKSGSVTVTEQTGTNGNTKEITGGTSDDHDWHIYGNIGVTTAQQMINEELKLRAQTMTKIIMDGFCNEYLALIPSIGDD